MDKCFRSKARRLRKDATDAERLLWRHLRNRQMLGYKFRRQVAVEPYIVDFVVFEAKLVIEADGGQHDEQRAYDAERSEYLVKAGYRVLRFWNNEVLNETESVLEQIKQALLERG